MLYDIEHTAATSILTRETKPPAWRIIVKHAAFGQSDCVLMPGFQRRKDAEIARQALLKHGLDTFEKLRRGQADAERIMFESLQW